MVRCCKAFLPQFRRQAKDGVHAGSRILNIASAAGKAIGAGGLTAYSASKHAAVAFSSGLHVDMASFGIQVCTICPTFHGTPMFMNAASCALDYHKNLPSDIKEDYGQGKTFAASSVNTLVRKFVSQLFFLFFGRIL